MNVNASIYIRQSPRYFKGYYIRVKAINSLVSEFLNKQSCSLRTQIISLGAGFDTLFFRFRDKFAASNCQVVEIDFPAVISTKWRLIRESQVLSSMLSPRVPTASPDVFLSDNYCMIGCDITDTGKLADLLVMCGIDYNAPTLLISECVLTYVEPDKVDAIIQWISSSFKNSIFCCYEQILPNDGFGKIMLRHFMSLGSPLKNIELYPTKSAHKQRLMKRGFSSVHMCDMNEFYLSLQASEKRRVDMIEPFDEFEDFYQKCSHYTLMLSVKGDCSIALPACCKTSHHAPVKMTPGTVGLDFPALSPSSAVVKRFGHSSVCLPNGNVVLIGGFGVSELSTAHRRLNDVLLFRQDGDQYGCKILPASGDVPAGIVHHRTVLLADGRILVTGGRQSPIHPQTDCLSITIEDMDCCRFKIVKFEAPADRIGPRWRHSANILMYQGHECLLITGGCTIDNSFLDDVILIQTSDWKCKKLPIHLPQGTHSHAAVTHDGGVIVMGGLNEEMVPLNMCYYIKHEEDDWSLLQLAISLPFTPRFSCGCCVHKDSVILVGGVGCLEDMEAVIINLKTDETTTYKIKAPRQNPPILLHCFTMHLLDDGAMWLFGGGGNCFSFGTHFNISPMRITI
ncbi:tRNA wybutosine-synthesizing protein 4-like isoform X2 [Halichondria panicea]|uniref:tRNA wybutosine-synthesizing protein 4-like isoform X2 n=1 Tax=Halichondria panicea TaxID=6063 RepID=UPI00312B3D60